MLTGLLVRDGHVSFAIQVDPERGPHLDPLRKAAEKAVSDLPGVLTVTAVLTAERGPGQAKAHDHGHDDDHEHGPNCNHGHGHGHGHGHAQDSRPVQKNLVPQIKTIVAVASGKGGVGKSTTSVNLAVAMSKLNLKVGLFDADVFGPSQPRMLGITTKPEAGANGKIKPISSHGIVCMSMGFLIEEGQAIVWRGPMVMGAIQQLLSEVEWGELDVLVVDLPPGTGDTQLTLTQSVPLSGAVIVSTPQDIALLDARKGIDMFRKTDIPILGIIENMSTYVCPKCGHEDHIFGHGGARKEAETLGVEFLGEVPLDISIRLAGDEGEPIVSKAPDSQHAAAYRAIAKRVWDKVNR
jgi:ATP-binding protein involved in chromosome partitioning